MRNFAPVIKLRLILLICIVGFSCSNGNKKRITTGAIPQFVVKDSLVVDYLGALDIIDIKPDRSEYLMYDYQRKEVLRIDSEGGIIINKDLSGDGKDSFGSYFNSAHYYGNDQLLFVTKNNFYFYDLDLNLIEKKVLPFSVFTNTVFNSHNNLLVGSKLFTNRITEQAFEEFHNRDDYLSSFPFLSVYDFEKEEILSEQFIPKESHLIKSPGKYRETAPHSIVLGDVLYLLFYYSPEIYKFSFPELSYLGKIVLNPSEYVQVKPEPKGELAIGAFNELAGSEFVHFSVSNDYFLTGYRGAAPQEKVDALPKNVLGGEAFMELVNVYKIPYYQIIRGEKKLWEGHIDIRFNFKGGHLFAKRDIHQPVVEEEKDEVAFYFYKID